MTRGQAMIYETLHIKPMIE